MSIHIPFFFVVVVVVILLLVFSSFLLSAYHSDKIMAINAQIKAGASGRRINKTD